MSIRPGVLYVVATPIGNLEDISPRAKKILEYVDIIAAEDTRHSKILTKALGISTPLRSYHEFNERVVTSTIIQLLQQGTNIALISDAGTPLINDPGYHLVNKAHEQGIKIIPIPGPSALVCALSAAGLATDKFCFEGYVPERQAARKKYFQNLQHETRTMVFYEAPHRILKFMDDAVAVFGEQRRAALARELTKKFESIVRAGLGELLDRVRSGEEQQKGEFVVLIEGASSSAEPGSDEAIRILKILLKSLPVKTAAAATAEITGNKKNTLYKLALEIIKHEGY